MPTASVARRTCSASRSASVPPATLAAALARDPDDPVLLKQRLTRARERLGFYESFDRIIQENIRRSGELMLEAMLRVQDFENFETLHTLLEVVDMPVRGQHADAPADRRRGVRHGAHDRGALAEHRREAGNCRAGCDRQHHGAAFHQVSIGGQHHGHGLRLDGANQRPRLQVRRQSPRIGDRADAVPRADALADGGIRLDDERVGGGEATAEPAVQQGAAHLAAADEQHVGRRLRKIPPACVSPHRGPRRSPH